MMMMWVTALGIGIGTVLLFAWSAGTTSRIIIMDMECGGLIGFTLCIHSGMAMLGNEARINNVLYIVTGLQSNSKKD